VAESKVVAVSVNYRKAPEHPLPAAYEDAWATLQWVMSHCSNGGPEAWLNEHADFERVFLAGESAGANIAHNLAMAAGKAAGKAELGPNLGLLGVALVHLYFWGSEPIGSEALIPGRKEYVDRLWPFVCPLHRTTMTHVRVNPVAKGAPSQ
jgi:acetyl esterase/lipase